MSGCCPVRPCAPLSFWCPSVLRPRWQTLCPPLVPKTFYVVIVQSRLCLFCWPRRLVRVCMPAWPGLVRVCLSCLSTLSALLPQPCLGLVRCFATPLFLYPPPCPGMFSCGYECIQCFKFDIILGFPPSFFTCDSGIRNCCFQSFLCTCRSQTARGYRYIIANVLTNIASLNNVIAETVWSMLV